MRIRNKMVLTYILIIFSVIMIPSTVGQEGPEMDVSTTLNVMQPEAVSILYGYMDNTTGVDLWLYRDPPLVNQTTYDNHTLIVSVDGPMPSIVVMIKDILTREQTYLTNPWPDGGNAVEYSPFNVTIDMSDYTQNRWYTLYIIGVSNGSSSSHYSRMFYLDDIPLVVPDYVDFDSPIKTDNAWQVTQPFVFMIIIDLIIIGCGLVITWRRR